MFSWLKGERREKNKSSRFSKDAALHSLRYVVLDTELTSLDKRANRLLSIGAIAMEGPRIQVGGQFYRVVNPGVPVPAESVLIHTLRSEDVEAGEPLSTVLEEFCGFIRGAVLIGHFLDIDLGVLRKELGASGHQMDNPAVDTARIHHWLLRQGPYSEDLHVRLEELDLPTVAKAYGLEQLDAHHALSDAFLTACAWQRMMPMAEQRGIRNLGQLLRIGRA